MLGFLIFLVFLQMMSEKADSYKHWNHASRENKRLREQVSILVAEKLLAAEFHAQRLTQMRESADGFLAAQLATEEKLSAAEEENQSMQE